MGRFQRTVQWHSVAWPVCTGPGVCSPRPHQAEPVGGLKATLALLAAGSTHGMLTARARLRARRWRGSAGLHRR
jgi:hypothetical protein